MGILGPIIAAGAPILLNELFGSNDAETTQSTERTPASWGSIGGPRITLEEPTQTWVPATKGRWEQKGHDRGSREQNPPVWIPGKEGYWKEEGGKSLPAGEALWHDLLTNLGGMDYGKSNAFKTDAQQDHYANVIRELENAKFQGAAVTDRYTDRLQDLSKPAFNVSVGGQDVGVTPRRNAMLADMASQIFGAKMGTMQNNLQYGTMAHEAALASKLGDNPYNDLQAQIENMWPYLTQMQAWRYGLPSDNVTSTASYNPSFSEMMGDVAQNATSFNDLWNTYKGGGAPYPDYDPWNPNYGLPTDQWMP